MSVLDNKNAIQLVAGFGGLVLTLFTVKLLTNFYKFFLRSGKDLKKLGKWAVITGATDGIGKAYAFKLASKGISLVLISRTKSKLEECEKEIKEKYPKVEVKVVVCDFSTFDEKGRATVSSALEGLDIGLLINNVGVSYAFPKYFSELTTSEVYSLMEMNVNSTTWMTHLVLPGMMSRSRGSVVNISSGSGTITCPLLAEYSAAKSYIIKFSEGLNAECKSKNVTVSCQVPYYVATKLAKMRKSLMVPTATEYVNLAVNWIGWKDDCVVSPFWMHAVQGWFQDTIPSSIADGVVLSMHLGIRKRALKKEQAKTK